MLTSFVAEQMRNREIQQWLCSVYVREASQHRIHNLVLAMTDVLPEPFRNKVGHSNYWGAAPRTSRVSTSTNGT